MGALQVRHESASAALVRSQMRADLQSDVEADSIDTVLLVASELVTNAVRHAEPTEVGTLHVEWELDGDTVMIRVTDPSPELPRLRAPAPTEPNGRGLAIVEALTDSWGADPGRCGKQVWARTSVQRDRRKFRVNQYARV